MAQQIIDVRFAPTADMYRFERVSGFRACFSPCRGTLRRHQRSALAKPASGFMVVILIVEDEDQVRVLAEGILQDGGHETLSASTAEQALALLDGAQGVDLVFTDIGLQSNIQAGLMLAQEATKQKSDLPVLYTTGQGLTDGMQALFVKNYAFLAKPYTPEQLLISVTNVLRLT